MKNINLKSRYRFRLELSSLIALVIVVTFFYSYPRFEQQFGINKPALEPDFIITDIPRTIQFLKKLKPSPPEIPSKFEEIAFMDDVEIIKNETSDSSNVIDSSEIALQYYEQLLPYLDLEKFDPNALTIESEPLDQYHQYLNKRLTEIFSEKSHKSRTNIDDILAQSMGRDPGMLRVDIGSVIDATKKYINSNNRRSIAVNSIVNSEKHWYILELLWYKNGQTIFEIYADEYVSKINTVSTLKESMSNLKENGLVFEIEDFERSRYYPAHNPDEMIEIINRLLAQDLPTQEKDILSAFVNFIIMNS